MRMQLPDPRRLFPTDIGTYTYAESSSSEPIDAVCTRGMLQDAYALWKLMHRHTGTSANFRLAWLGHNNDD